MSWGLDAAIRAVATELALEWPGVTSPESLESDLRLEILDRKIESLLDSVDPAARSVVLYTLAGQVIAQHLAEFRKNQPDRVILSLSHVRSILNGERESVNDLDFDEISPEHFDVLRKRYGATDYEDLFTPPTPEQVLKAEIALTIHINQLGGYLATKTTKENKNG